MNANLQRVIDSDATTAASRAAYVVCDSRLAGPSYTPEMWNAAHSDYGSVLASIQARIADVLAEAASLGTDWLDLRDVALRGAEWIIAEMTGAYVPLLLT